MKKIFLCLISVAMLLSITACSKKGDKSEIDSKAEVVKDKYQVSELSIFDEATNLYDSTDRIITGGKYTLKGSIRSTTLGIATENPVAITVKDTSNYYYSFNTISSEQNYLVKDNKPYILDIAEKKYVVSEEKTADSIKKSIDELLPTKESLKYKDTFKVSYNENTYVRERYTYKDKDDSTISFFYNDSDLKIIEYKNQVMEMSVDSFLTVESITDTVDETYFDKLKEYQKITSEEMNDLQNGASSSEETITSMLNSMGITDEKLADMGYTKEDILNMDKNQLSVFFAGIYGEDISE